MRHWANGWKIEFIPALNGGLAMFVSYLTERKRAEEALRKLHAELAHVMRATTMGEMAASIAHEINQPLGAIVNNGTYCLRLLGKPGAEEKKREALQDVVNDANRASEIISRIRALTKRPVTEITKLHASDVIADVLALSERSLAEHHVRVRTQLNKGLPQLPVDRVQLQQVLLNLITNAIEAMSGRGTFGSKTVLTMFPRRDCFQRRGRREHRGPQSRECISLRPPRPLRLNSVPALLG